MLAGAANLAAATVTHLPPQVAARKTAEAAAATEAAPAQTRPGGPTEMAGAAMARARPLTTARRMAAATAVATAAATVVAAAAAAEEVPLRRPIRRTAAARRIPHHPNQRLLEVVRVVVAMVVAATTVYRRDGQNERRARTRSRGRTQSEHDFSCRDKCNHMNAQTLHAFSSFSSPPFLWFCLCLWHGRFPLVHVALRLSTHTCAGTRLPWTSAHADDTRREHVYAERCVDVEVFAAVHCACASERALRCLGRLSTLGCVRTACLCGWRL